MPPSLTALNPDNNTSQKKWKNLLKEETESEYFLKLKSFIKEQRSKGKIIYPQDSEILNALHFTPLENVKVVILGQDPYHGPGQAHGLCFSVQAGVPAPPSLVNIFLEIKNDLGISTPNHGHLVSWATQGVLLLNAVLSVENGKPGSHANMGWEKFTDKIVSIVNDNCEGVVFLLWGSYAQKKGGIINRKKHHVFTAPHPSPLSSYRGFFGCKHFSETNRILKNHGKTEINWQLHSYPNK
ncbi:MAG: uracil-DNA glycosylase [bacterium]|nr:uracil-DNA glycosylase [bacterium]